VRPDDRSEALSALLKSRSDLPRCVFQALGKVCNWGAVGDPIVEFYRAKTHYGVKGKAPKKKNK
jgi:hypothetical protein